MSIPGNGQIRQNPDGTQNRPSRRSAALVAFCLSMALLGCGPKRSVPQSATPPEQAQLDNGRKLLSAGDARGAIGAFDTAIRINARFAPAYFALAGVQAKSGDLPKAISTLEALRRAAPHTPHIACRMAELRAATGSFVDSVAAAQDAMAAEPDCPVAMTEYGLALAAAGRTKEATAKLREAHDLAPDNPRISVALAQLLARSGQPSEAWKTINALPGVLESPQLNYIRAWLLAEYGKDGKRDHNAAVALLDPILAQAPNDGPANQEKGRILLRQGDARAALPFLTRALRNSDPSVDLLSAVADAKTRLKDPAAAQVRKDAQSFAKYADSLYAARQRYLDYPTDRGNLIKLAHLEAAMGHTQDAHALLTQVLQQNPNDREALDLLTPAGVAEPKSRRAPGAGTTPSR